MRETPFGLPSTCLRGEPDEDRSDHGSRGPGLPRLQRRVPRRSGHPCGCVHRRADPRHRRPRLPGVARGAALPGGDPDPAGGGARGADRRARRRRGRARVLRPLARGRDAPRVPRARRRSELRPARPARDDDRVDQAGDRRHRGADGVRQEPDEPQDRGAPARGGPPGRARAAPDAVRRSRGDARAALRDAGRHRRREPDRRGARGVRVAGGAGDDHVRRRRLRRDPRPRRSPRRT